MSSNVVVIRDREKKGERGRVREKRERPKVLR